MNLSMGEKTPKQLFRENAKGLPAKQLLQATERLKAYLKELEEHGRPPQYIEKARREGLQAIQNDYYAAAAAEKARAEKRLGELKSSYETDYQRNLTRNAANLSILSLRYQAMGEKDLEDELIRVQSEGGPHDPYAVYLLMKEAKNMGVDTTDFRQQMNAKHFTEPWLHTPEGQELSAHIKIYDNPKPETALTIMVDGNGKAKTAGFSFGELMEPDDVTDGDDDDTF